MNSLDDTPGRRIRLGNNNSTAAFTYGAGAVVPLVLSNRQIEHYAGSEYGASLNNNATNTSSTVTVNTDLMLTGNANKPFTLGGSNTGNNTFAGAITNKPGYVTSLTKAGTGNGTLTVGRQTCSVECTELTLPYVAGQQAQITVMPEAGSVFVRWETADGTPLTGLTYMQPGDTVIAVFEKQ